MLESKQGQMSMFISVVVAILALMIMMVLGFVSGFFNWPGKAIEISCLLYTSPSPRD